MSRIALVDERGAAAGAKPFYAKGDPGAIVATLAHVPDLMSAALPFVARTFGPSEIPLRTKEIVVLRASSNQRCRFCTQTHTAIALDAGLGVAEVRALRGEAPVGDAFRAPADRALVAWTDAVAAGPAPIEQRLLDELRRHFSDAQVVGLTLLVGATVMLNRFATAFDLPVSETHRRRVALAGLA
jgi:AhpD family alkylhydroperoxidase